jgi:putative transposase
VSWPDRSGWKLDTDTRRLHLYGVGAVPVRFHRRLQGEARTLTVRRRGRHWEVTVFCAQVPPRRLAATGTGVGIDVGVTVWVATSEGELFANPRPGRVWAARLAGAQRDQARRRPGSLRYRQAAAAAARVKAKQAWIRKDHCHQVSRRLVDTYEVICHEDLRIVNLVRSARGSLDEAGVGVAGVGVAAKAGLNRAITDSGRGRLLSMIAYKAEDAGRLVIAVNPRHTSQRCPRGGHVARDNRAGVVFRCQRCGHRDHADINAAVNILRAGLAHQHPGAKSGNAAA